MATPIITLLFLLAAANADAMNNHEPALSEPPNFDNPSPKAPIARDLDASSSKKTTSKAKHSEFGSGAAESVEEAISLGLVKNEHPNKPGTPLLQSLEVGHCVIVPRSDKSLSYGVVTEVISPSIVCVACDQTKNGFTTKIIASNELFLRPEWLSHDRKDLNTVAKYRSTNASSAKPDQQDEK